MFIYVTASSQKEAKNIAGIVIKKRLAACANIFPISSMYKWKGKICEEKEWVLILKTTKNKSILAKKEIEKIHSYQVPCIMEISVNPNKKYRKWMENQL
ncbi:divalent-cation tolerance protein CutA [Candidatus Woesearchaeota archaeon]|nr:divalent-cation tolerance protein CutA [Candidatus Woesearchaeota archaeon]